MEKGTYGAEKYRGFDADTALLICCVKTLVDKT